MFMSNDDLYQDGDNHSYFCKFDQLKGIVCNIGGPQYSVEDSCYIPMEKLYPDECY